MSRRPQSRKRAPARRTARRPADPRTPRRGQVERVLAAQYASVDLCEPRLKVLRLHALLLVARNLLVMPVVSHGCVKADRRATLNAAGDLG